MAKNKGKELKTNAVRILEKLGIEFKQYTYVCDNFVDGVQIADMLGQELDRVYKTLVTMGNSRGYYVFVIPVAKELDLKRAAKCVAEKSLMMLPVKEIHAVTGYIRGGCTAVGMKKAYPVLIDASAIERKEMIVSGGRLGLQVELAVKAFQEVTGGKFGDVCCGEKESG